MRCKNHYADLSSTVGICASCLRDRLFPLLAAQEQTLTLTLDDHNRNSDANPPLNRSVSPFTNCRNSDQSTDAHQNIADRRFSDHSAAAHQNISNRRFYTTPQARPVASGGDLHHKKRGFIRFFLFANFFRSKNRNKAKSDPDSDPNPRVSVSNVTDGGNAAASPSWFSMSGGNRRKKQPCYDPSTAAVARKQQCRDRGMSPVRFDELNDGSSGYDSSESWNHTPAHMRNRRSGPGTGTGGGNGRNISGLAFCLSPLVRASPNRHWKKAMPTAAAADGGIAGDIRAPAKPHLAVAKSFCANRSRKLADFGRINPNR